MTTSSAPNVHNVAIEGSFDDTQALLKQLFADQAFATAHRLAAINSINWVRIAVQSAYYVAACLALQKEALTFSVPTGNFGDAFAGYVAKRLGAPVKRLIVATNANDTLVDTIATGRYSPSAVHATLSPAMDIQVASNFERMLFECNNRNSVAVRAMMESLANTGSLRMHPAAHAVLRGIFSADRVLDSETVATMKIVHRQTGLQLDPHTAVGLTATRIASETEDVVTLATAHPAKFLEAVHIATGVKPELPEQLRWVLTAPERFDTLPNDLQALRRFIEQSTRPRSG
jgi:threonine synthase